MATAINLLLTIEKYQVLHLFFLHTQSLVLGDKRLQEVAPISLLEIDFSYTAELAEEQVEEPMTKISVAHSIVFRKKNAQPQTKAWCNHYP